MEEEGVYSTSLHEACNGNLYEHGKKLDARECLPNQTAGQASDMQYYKTNR